MSQQLHHPNFTVIPQEPSFSDHVFSSFIVFHHGSMYSMFGCAKAVLPSFSFKIPMTITENLRTWQTHPDPGDLNPRIVQRFWLAGFSQITINLGFLRVI